MRTPLFQPLHRQESLPPKDVVSLAMRTTNISGYSIDGDPPVFSDDVFDMLQHCRHGDLHRPTDSTFVFDTCLPFRELLHSIMDCLT
jgi:hypothetical protein